MEKSSKTLEQLGKTMEKSSKTTEKLNKTMEEPSKTMEKSSKTMEKWSDTLGKSRKMACKMACRRKWPVVGGAFGEALEHWGIEGSA